MQESFIFWRIDKVLLNDSGYELIVVIIILLVASLIILKNMGTIH